MTDLGDEGMNSLGDKGKTIFKELESLASRAKAAEQASKGLSAERNCPSIDYDIPHAPMQR